MAASWMLACRRDLIACEVRSRRRMCRRDGRLTRRGRDLCASDVPLPVRRDRSNKRKRLEDSVDNGEEAAPDDVQIALAASPSVAPIAQTANRSHGGTRVRTQVEVSPADVPAAAAVAHGVDSSGLPQEPTPCNNENQRPGEVAGSGWNKRARRVGNYALLENGS